jgi:rhodanese-related sulfurtransferase
LNVEKTLPFMSHNTRTSGLIIVAVLFTAVIALGLILSRDDDPEYEMSTTQALEQLGENFAFLSLEEARELRATDALGYTFIDLRSPDVFGKGHIEGAVNIPIYHLLDPATLDRFQDTGTTFVLYGQDISVGAGACALLRQLGIANIQALQGCYGTYSSGAPSPVAEAANFDYQAVFDEVGTEERGNRTAAPVEAPQNIILPTKRATKVASEGC